MLLLFWQLETNLLLIDDKRDVVRPALGTLGQKPDLVPVAHLQLITLASLLVCVNVLVLDFFG